MKFKPCLTCGKPATSARCEPCTTSHNRARGSSTARGYNAEHRAARAAWESLVATGTVVCRRAPFGLCVAEQATIAADEPWQLGHPDHACPAPRAPEHVKCNSGAPHRKI